MKISMKLQLKLAIFLLLCFYTKSSEGRPRPSSPRKVPKFLKQLYAKLVTGEAKLPSRVTIVHGIFAVVKPYRGGSKQQKSNVVDLLADFASTIPHINRTKKSKLHVHTKSRAANANSRAVPPKFAAKTVCKLHIHDVKTSKKIASRRILCNQSRTYEIRVTRFVNKWLKNPSTNLGIRVKVSSNTVSKTPMATLPFIDSSSHVEQPYYILYN